MCGRFTLTVGPDMLAKRFETDGTIAWEPSYNVAPTQDVIAVVNDGEQNRIGQMSWGLIPSWAKDESMRHNMINARLETADQKPSYKKLLAKRRCLIVADSFYEWMTIDGQKQPVRIYSPDQELFTFAGLWDRWQTEAGEKVTCTILTKEANDDMAEIHHRMPVMLRADQEQEWINFAPQNASDMKDWLYAQQDLPLTYDFVSTYVNNPKHNDPSCIEPVSL
ncbi:SOS response-associated peptidase [Alkalibacillus almallahensis]|uniref:SOS response-associated peptidase n=1 Tax=Alkalibacillus almallahensis TaxID=1379154 RepID=UPI001421DF62|nr:SOS response-associated peptidase [Alkalibacillus almallahensis]NIK11762.1 putative SOS response-associated peptidase YedK [Alkalibacillus almallahensis]